jgi:hypothetical protein
MDESRQTVGGTRGGNMLVRSGLQSSPTVKWEGTVHFRTTAQRWWPVYGHLKKRPSQWWYIMGRQHYTSTTGDGGCLGISQFVGT